MVKLVPFGDGRNVTLKTCSDSNGLLLSISNAREHCIEPIGLLQIALDASLPLRKLSRLFRIGNSTCYPLRTITQFGDTERNRHDSPVCRSLGPRRNSCISVGASQTLLYDFLRPLEKLRGTAQQRRPFLEVFTHQCHGFVRALLRAIVAH
jgi:hypothetical protein